MTCEHWKRCGACHSPGLVDGLRKVEENLRARVAELESHLDDGEAWYHEGLTLRARVAQLEKAVRQCIGMAEDASLTCQRFLEPLRACVEKSERELCHVLDELDAFPQPASNRIDRLRERVRAFCTKPMASVSGDVGVVEGEDDGRTRDQQHAHVPLSALSGQGDEAAGATVCNALRASDAQPDQARLEAPVETPRPSEALTEEQHDEPAHWLKDEVLQALVDTFAASKPRFERNGCRLRDMAAEILRLRVPRTNEAKATPITFEVDMGARSNEPRNRPDGCDCWGTSTCSICAPRTGQAVACVSKSCPTYECFCDPRTTKPVTEAVYAVLKEWSDNDVNLGEACRQLGDIVRALLRTDYPCTNADCTRIIVDLKEEVRALRDQRSETASPLAGAKVLVPARDTTEGGSRLGKVEGVLTRVQVRRRDGTLGYYEPAELENAHHCFEPDCEACVTIDAAFPSSVTGSGAT